MKHKSGTPNYFLLDGARVDESLAGIIAANPDHVCLYKGKSERHLAALAPYLFIYHAKTALSLEYLHNGWGNSWGVLFDTSYPMEAMLQHFRKFLIVQTEDFKELYFRFYDPRVLRIFLPTCNTAQLKEFFGPIGHFICEDEDPEFAIIFSLTNGKLVADRKPMTIVFPELKKEKIS